MPTHHNEPRTQVEGSANGADTVVSDLPERDPSRRGVEHLARGLRTADREIAELRGRIVRLERLLADLVGDEDAEVLRAAGEDDEPVDFSVE